MHAERLNSIISEIIDDYDHYEPVATLRSLIEVVNNRLSNPTERSYDEAISTTSKQLFAELESLSINQFPPISRKLMTELNLENLTPEIIRQRVEKAFADRFVDSDLVTSLNQIVEDIEHDLGAIRKLKEGFDLVGISNDVPDDNEVEFDVAMPRDAIDDHLGGFGKLLGQINKHLLVLSSIAKGEREALQINSISSNDFTVALNINVDLAEIITAILVGLAAMRTLLRNAQKAFDNPALKDLPPNLVAPIKAWASEQAREEIRKIAEGLAKSAPKAVDAKKLKAHTEAVVTAITYLERKQELGFNMEVRVGYIDEAEKKDGESEARHRALVEARDRLTSIVDKTAQLKVLDNQENPILSLSDNTERDGD